MTACLSLNFFTGHFKCIRNWNNGAYIVRVQQSWKLEFTKENSNNNNNNKSNSNIFGKLVKSRKHLDNNLTYFYESKWSSNERLFRKGSFF